MPAAGQGTDNIYGYVFQHGDTLDLRQLVAATTWNGSQGTLQNYLEMGVSGKNAVLFGRDTTSGAFHAIATFEGSGAVNLSTLLADAIT